MPQDATQCLMGVPLSSDHSISHHDSDPATFKAGLAVSLGNTGALSLLKSAGGRIGVSLGRNLSNTSKVTSVCREGGLVPMQVALKRARGTITITSYANLVSGTADKVTVNGVDFTAQAGAVTPGGATFQAATSNNATAASLAAQINAHATVGLVVRAVAASAVVTIAAVVGGSAGNSIALGYTDNDTNAGATKSGTALASGSDTVDGTAIDWVVDGAHVYIDDISGMATDGTLPGCTVSNAIYRDTVKTGVLEDATTCAAALVDMLGGL